VRVSVPRSSGGGKRRRHHGGGSGGSALSQQKMISVLVGGAALGFVDKAFPQLPTIPVLGRAGSLALYAYFAGKGKGHGILRDIAIAGAAIAGYQLGGTGHVSGLAPQVSGIAAQV
jgi:hypothetical protein